MFLKNPTIAELQLLDMQVLVEMLSQQTDVYIQMVNEEGFTDRTMTTKELLDNIQAAIGAKRQSEMSQVKNMNIIPDSSSQSFRKVV